MIESKPRGQEKGGGIHKFHHKACFVSGNVNWTEMGFYRVSVTKKTDNTGWIVTLTHTFIGKTVTLDEDVTGNDSGFGTYYGIEDNFSQTRAILKTPQDEWRCASFFPMLNRQLRKKNSEEIPIVSVGRPKWARQSSFVRASGGDDEAQEEKRRRLTHKASSSSVTMDTPKAKPTPKAKAFPTEMSEQPPPEDFHSQDDDDE